MRLVLLSLFVLACKEGEGGKGSGDDPSAGATDLPLPDLDGIDLEAAYEEIFTLAWSAVPGRAWSGLGAALDLRQEGCPDVYAGPPPGSDLALDAGGQSWADWCETGDGGAWQGNTWWNAAIDITGDPEDATGETVIASRELEGDGLVTDADGTLFEIDGDASDDLYVVTAPGYSRWTWSGELDAALSGSLATPDLDRGLRASLKLDVAGGDAETAEMRGNLYFYDALVQGRFDSFSAQVVFFGEAGSGPNTCTAEPSGWLAIRDQDAVWYDLVFLPADREDVTRDEEWPCDGCATLYLRGVEATEVGLVCPDLGGIWEGLAPIPTIEDYVLPLRELGEGVDP